MPFHRFPIKIIITPAKHCPTAGQGPLIQKGTISVTNLYIAASSLTPFYSFNEIFQGLLNLCDVKNTHIQLKHTLSFCIKTQEAYHGYHQLFKQYYFNEIPMLDSYEALQHV